MTSSHPSSGAAKAELRIQLVAYVFALLGAIAWADSARAVVQDGALHLGLELILLPAAIGLLRKKDAWRKATRTLLLVAAGLALLVLVLAVFVSPPNGITILGRALSASRAVQIAVMLAYTGGYLLIVVWIYRLLGSAGARSAFAEESSSR